MRGAVFPYILLGALFRSTRAQDSSTRKCYNGDGTDRNEGSATPAYIPCSNDEVSMCCAAGNGGSDECDPYGKIGLCYNPESQKYWRESCTDPTWQSPSCIRLFMNGTGIDGTATQIINGNNLTDVDITPCDDGSWCYGTNNILCCSQRQGYFINYVTGKQEQDTNGALPPPSATTVTVTASNTHSSSQMRTGTAAAASQSHSPTSTPSSSSSSSDSLSGGAIAGIVVGVVAGLVLGVCVGWLLSRKRRKAGPAELSGESQQHTVTPSEKQEGGGSKSVWRRSEMASPSRTPRHELPTEHNDSQELPSTETTLRSTPSGTTRSGTTKSGTTQSQLRNEA